MSAVINTNMAAIRTHNVYNRNNTEMNAAMTRVATAQKVNSAKDNASVWAISERMRERIRANDQANQNVQNDTALLKTAQEGIGNTLDILKTLKERAINSANDSNIGSDRTKIVEEVKQLVQQIDDNAAKVKFNGRALLNGATDPTSGSTSSTGTVAPTSVTASGTYGDMAVYGITNLYKSAAAGNGLDLASAGTDLLTNLRDSSGQALFKAGDKITLSWKDNGVEMTKSIAVTSGTALSDITGTGLSATFATEGNDTGANDANGADVLAPATGLYIKGAANHNISDFSIAVTNSAGTTKTAAQAALEPTAVQQSYGDTTKGTNMVYQVNVTRSVEVGSAVPTTVTDDDPFYYLGIKDKDTAGETYTLKVNDREITFSGSESINDINDRLKNEGFNIRMHYADALGGTLNYDGQTVNVGTYGGSKTYETASPSMDKSLYFIGAQGEDINYISIKSGTSGTSGAEFATEHTTALAYNATPASGQGIQKLVSLDNTSASSSSSSSSLLPQGEALQFYVGGESNFGINFSIGKATVQTLLGSSVDGFASKFSTSEGAESAIETIDNAINKTLTEQTRLGAMEARLGYTSDNLTTMNENLEAGVSAYRDADMAKEMTTYMKYSVLAQASQYMLAQAGQNAFSVLNLLQA